MGRLLKTPKLRNVGVVGCDFCANKQLPSGARLNTGKFAPCAAQQDATGCHETHDWYRLDAVEEEAPGSDRGSSLDNDRR